MPIIKSLLDIDFYKFTMGQLVFHRYRDVPVVYSFINRTKGVRLADIIDETDLRQELEHAKTLKFNKTELHYLRGTNEYSGRMFKEDYLEFLSGFQNYKPEFPGRWLEAIYWETIALAIINELYYPDFMNRLNAFGLDQVYAMEFCGWQLKLKG